MHHQARKLWSHDECENCGKEGVSEPWRRADGATGVRCVVCGIFFVVSGGRA